MDKVDISDSVTNENSSANIMCPVTTNTSQVNPDVSINLFEPHFANKESGKKQGTR